MEVSVSPAVQHAFGKYTLVAKLATGGMAEIFLARLEGAAGFQKLVCIKRLLPQFAKDKQLVTMFLAEAKLAAQISHSNVCSVFELGEIDGRYFIAMEYLQGVPLACFRRANLYPRPPDPRLVVGLGAQACEGLHHAHHLRRADGATVEVIHRDVSGTNLFATVDGTVKVLDFGIAKVQDSTTRTSTGSVKGTYAYMAPEQLRNERLDRRTDVFALGIVMWELLAQRHLFRRDTEYLTFAAITSEPIPDLCDLRDDIPAALADAIAGALSRDRNTRWPTARAFGEAMSEAVGPYGGPLAPLAIGAEIEAAFADRLHQQRGLIQLASSGGALGLEDDVGPNVGHGTELMTTPLSIISSLGVAPPPALVAGSPMPMGSPTTPAPLTGAPTRSHTPLWIAAMIIVAVAAAAGAVWVMKGREAPQAPSVAVAVSPDAARAPVIEPEPEPDQSERSGSGSGSGSGSEPAATAEPRTRQPPKRTHRSERSDRDRDRDRDGDRDRGPPGFITIDSTPVYAVIYIDGKKRGETPLVRIPLAPGKHSVRAVSPSGSSKTLTIRITSGKESPARRIEW